MREYDQEYIVCAPLLQEEDEEGPCTTKDSIVQHLVSSSVEDETETWEYGQPENIFMEMEDYDSSYEEDQIAELARRINLEILRNKCSGELEELRRSENQPQGHEQNNAIHQQQTIENPILEVDEIVPRRVSEWFALIDHNREREIQGLEPIYSWANHQELATVVETGDEANSSHYSDFARSLSHLSLEDGNLTRVHDNSLSWEEDALINDALEGDCYLL